MYYSIKLQATRHADPPHHIQQKVAKQTPWSQIAFPISSIFSEKMKTYIHDDDDDDDDDDTYVYDTWLAGAPP